MLQMCTLQFVIFIFSNLENSLEYEVNILRGYYITVQ